MQFGLFALRNFIFCSYGKLASNTAVAIATVSVILLGAIGNAQSNATADGQTATVHVDVTPGHAINSFDPDSALGSSIDVLSREGIDKVYTPHIIQESLSAGWGPITYRNNTELRMAAWHWNANGTWSDPAHRADISPAAPNSRNRFATFSPTRCRTAVFDQWRSPAARAQSQLLEEQSISHQQIHRRKRRATSAMGRGRSASRKASERGAHRLGKSLCHELPGGILGGNTRTRFR